jgi:hypothetical protein
MTGKGSGAVQFRGVDKILRAYEFQKIPMWAIFYGNDLFTKYETERGDVPDMETGKALLKEVLESMDDDSGISTYKLRVYDGVKNGDKVKSNTPYDASFNFSVLKRDQGSYYENRSRREEDRDNEIASLKAMVETLTKQLNEEDDEDDQEEEKPDGIMGVLSGIMKMPAVEQAIAAQVGEVVKMFAAKIMPINHGGNQIGKIAGLPADSPQAVQPAMQPAPIEANDDEQQDRMQEALDILYPIDPLLGDHLLKIAAIAKADPEKYKMLIAML